MTLVLASGSPRRLALLRAGGVEPVVHPADVDETPRPDASPGATVRRLATDKATVAADVHGGAVVLGADTEVARDGAVLGKPADEDEAAMMLRANSGRVLSVWSGVAVVAAGRVTTRVVGSFVLFTELSDAAVAAYVATGEPFGAAGAFRIQGRGERLIADRTGCWTNIVGLPTCQTSRLLAPHGIRLSADGCQTPAAS